MLRKRLDEVTAPFYAHITSQRVESADRMANYGLPTAEIVPALCDQRFADAKKVAAEVERELADAETKLKTATVNVRDAYTTLDELTDLEAVVKAVVNSNGHSVMSVKYLTTSMAVVGTAIQRTLTGNHPGKYHPLVRTLSSLVYGRGPSTYSLLASTLRFLPKPRTLRGLQNAGRAESGNMSHALTQLTLYLSVLNRWDVNAMNGTIHYDDMKGRRGIRLSRAIGLLAGVRDDTDFVGAFTEEELQAADEEGDYDYSVCRELGGQMVGFIVYVPIDGSFSFVLGTRVSTSDDDIGVHKLLTTIWRYTVACHAMGITIRGCVTDQGTLNTSLRDMMLHSGGAFTQSSLANVMTRISTEQANPQSRGILQRLCNRKFTPTSSPRDLADNNKLRYATTHFVEPDIHLFWLACIEHALKNARTAAWLCRGTAKVGNAHLAADATSQAGKKRQGKAAATTTTATTSSSSSAATTAVDDTLAEEMSGKLQRRIAMKVDGSWYPVDWDHIVALLTFSKQETGSALLAHALTVESVFLNSSTMMKMSNFDAVCNMRTCWALEKAHEEYTRRRNTPQAEATTLDKRQLMSMTNPKGTVEYIHALLPIARHIRSLYCGKPYTSADDDRLKTCIACIDKLRDNSNQWKELLKKDMPAKGMAKRLSMEGLAPSVLVGLYSAVCGIQGMLSELPTGVKLRPPDNRTTEGEIGLTRTATTDTNPFVIDVERHAWRRRAQLIDAAVLKGQANSRKRDKDGDTPQTAFTETQWWQSLKRAEPLPLFEAMGDTTANHESFYKSVKYDYTIPLEDGWSQNAAKLLSELTQLVCDKMRTWKRYNIIINHFVTNKAAAEALLTYLDCLCDLVNAAFHYFIHPIGRGLNRYKMC